MQKKSLIFFLGLIALTIVAVIFVMQTLKANGFKQDLVDLAALKQELVKDGLEEKNAQLLSAAKSIDTVRVLEDSSLLWSNVLKDVRRVLPKDGNVPKVEVVSYSGSGSEDLSLNVRTVGGSPAPYLDVAELIESFSSSVNFYDVFVPSITNSVDSNGAEILSFNVNLSYREGVDPVSEPVGAVSR